MGNKINVDMMPDVCQQIITKNDANDLRVTTSVSRQFAEDAKQWSKKTKINDNKLLKIEVSKESQSDSKYTLDIHPQSIMAQSSCSRMYSMETEDSENDAVLSNDFIMRKLMKNKSKSYSRSGTFLEIPQSRTDTADLDSKTIEAIIDGLQTKPTNDKMRTKSNSSSIQREFEKQLKQEQHEKDILRMENERLRKKIAALSMMKTLSKSISVSKSMSVSKSDSTFSKGSQHEISHRLLSPRSSVSFTSPCAPIAFNWNISSSSSNHHLTPQYSPHSKMTTPHSTTCSSVIPDFEKDVSVNQSCEKCESLSECSSIKRIIGALQWYRENGDDHECVYKKMKRDNYGKQIVNDYNHILEQHFDSDKRSNEDIQKEYNLIFAEVNKHVEPCKFQHEECAGYRRYLRSKCNRNLHKAQNPKQHELQMFVNTMDGIHCSFMHLGK